MRAYGYFPAMTPATLLDCAQNEGGRAVMAIRDGSDPATVFHFAASACSYAALFLAADTDEPTGYKPESAALYNGTPGSASITKD